MHQSLPNDVRLRGHAPAQTRIGLLDFDLDGVCYIAALGFGFRRDRLNRAVQRDAWQRIKRD